LYFFAVAGNQLLASSTKLMCACSTLAVKKAIILKAGVFLFACAMLSKLKHQNNSPNSIEKDNCLFIFLQMIMCVFF